MTITQERLKELLHYDPETGIFRWREGLGKPYTTSGKVTGYKRNHGYLVIRIDDKEYLAHRLAWMYVYGDFPQHTIDHINRVRDDNRICNLRACTLAENMQNKGTYKNNTTGCKGISFNSREGKYKVRITVEGKRTCLGTYNDLDEAINVYNEAQVKLNPFGAK